MGRGYEQSAGNMYKDDELIESGYSGSLTSKSNPDRQQAKGFGPSPHGAYKIVGHSTSKGPMTTILKQTFGETFGYSEFRIHDERKCDPTGLIPEGCIILFLTTRRLILRNSDDLEAAR